MMVVDELSDALDAVEALEEGLDASDECSACAASEGAIDSDRSAVADVNDLVEESVTFEKNQKLYMPSGCQPMDSIVGALSIFVPPLSDYIQNPSLKRLVFTSPEHRSLVYEKVIPALKHFSKFWDA